MSGLREPMRDRVCRVIALPGLTDYNRALILQRQLARAQLEGGTTDDILLLLQHPRVITLGRGADEKNVTASRESLQGAGVEVVPIERGGDVTYHGPGQLVGYPIFDLRRHRQDLHWYLRQLEEALIRMLAMCEISGRRVPGYTGVWVDDRKIASIGVHVTHWITFHGFALNVSTDLRDFDLIIPCGIEAVTMTSIEQESEIVPSIEEAGDMVAAAFGDVFGLALQREAPEFAWRAISLSGPA